MPGKFQNRWPNHHRQLPRGATDAQRNRVAHAVNLNNSDIDFCEWQGQLVINYSWGNQEGTEHLAEAVYEGTEAQFLRGWFPER